MQSANGLYNKSTVLLKNLCDFFPTPILFEIPNQHFIFKRSGDLWSAARQRGAVLHVRVKLPQTRPIKHQGKGAMKINWV